MPEMEAEVMVGKSSEEFQRFLDENQYTKNSIKRYTRIFGDDFVSTGGRAATEKLLEHLNLTESDHVLDVGCGTGCAAFLMVEKYGVNVQGVDLSSNMIGEGCEKLKRMPHEISSKIKLAIMDVTKEDFPPESFSGIFTKDAMLHIKDKLSLFTKFHKWLKPGGRLLISDYCLGSAKQSPKFEKYLAQRGYHLMQVHEYEMVLKDSGFQNATANDHREVFRGILQSELQRLKAQKSEFVRDFTENDYNDLVNGWEDKLEYTSEQAGDMTWSIMKGVKL